MSDLEDSLVTSLRAVATGIKTEHRTPVSRYEQLTAASGPQMLPTSNVWGADAAVRCPFSAVSWEFNVPFQHKYGYIRDKRSGVESYPYPVKESQQYINLNPGRLYVQQPPIKERDWEAHLNYYASD